MATDSFASIDPSLDLDHSILSSSWAISALQSDILQTNRLQAFTGARRGPVRGDDRIVVDFVEYQRVLPTNNTCRRGGFDPGSGSMVRNTRS
jgi:hypothetical protein